MERQSSLEARRKFLKTAGKFAVYTPPALMIMSKSGHASFAKSAGGVDDNNNTDEDNMPHDYEDMPDDNNVTEDTNTNNINNPNPNYTSNECGDGLLAELFCKYYK